MIKRVIKATLKLRMTTLVIAIVIGIAVAVSVLYAFQINTESCNGIYNGGSFGGSGQGGNW